MYDYPGASDMTPQDRIQTLESTVAELKVRLSRVESEHESLLEVVAFRRDFELLKDYLDRWLWLAVPAANVAGAVAEAPAAAKPPADNAELLALLAELVDLVLKSLANGSLDVSKAANLKLRVQNLCG